MDKLLPCPFCGGEPELDVYEPCDDYPGNQIYRWAAGVSCGCGVHSPILRERFKDDDQAGDAAIAAWNTRHTPGGWTLVPDQPTDEMSDAAYEADSVPVNYDQWIAMLAAAPKWGGE